MGAQKISFSFRPIFRQLIWTLVILASLNSCARYGISLYEAPDRERVSEKLEMPAKVLTAKLETYLRRERLLANVMADPKLKQTYLDCVWVRDTSLRYYYLHWDTRGRHRSNWKIVWRVRELGKNSSELSAEVFEVLFWGPAEETPNKAEPDSGNWVQTPPDGYRLSREYAKFLGQIFRRDSAIVRRYDQVQAPDLQFRPVGERLKTLPEPTIFSGPYFF